MKQNKAVVGSMLAIFVYTLMPNVSAFFGRSISIENSMSSRRNWKNTATSNKKVVSRSPYSSSSTTLSALPTLLADPMPNSIGNFFENKTDDMSFIQCYMLSVAVVDGLQYGTCAI